MRTIFVPRWESSPDTVKRNLLLPFLLTILIAVLFTRNFINIDLDSTISLLNLIGSFLLLIYISGRLYGEFFVYNDFIEIENNEIIFRDTPGMAMGWLPRNGSISFDVIAKVDMVEITSFLNPNLKYPALHITPSFAGKVIIVGNKLGYENIGQIVIQLKGRVTLSWALNQLLGDDANIDDTLKQAVDFAKSVWKRFQESRK